MLLLIESYFISRFGFGCVWIGSGLGLEMFLIWLLLLWMIWLLSGLSPVGLILTVCRLALLLKLLNWALLVLLLFWVNRFRFVGWLLFELKPLSPEFVLRCPKLLKEDEFLLKLLLEGESLEFPPWRSENLLVLFENCEVFLDWLEEMILLLLLFRDLKLLFGLLEKLLFVVVRNEDVLKELNLETGCRFWPKPPPVPPILENLLCCRILSLIWLWWLVRICSKILSPALFFSRLLKYWALQVCLRSSPL